VSGSVCCVCVRAYVCARVCVCVHACVWCVYACVHNLHVFMCVLTVCCLRVTAQVFFGL